VVRLIWCKTLLEGVERSKHPRSSNRFAEPVRGTVLHVYSRRDQASSARLPTALEFGGFRLVHGVCTKSAAGEQIAGTLQYWDGVQPEWRGVKAPSVKQWLSSPIRASERWAECRLWRAQVVQTELRLGRRCSPEMLAVLYRVSAAGQEIDRLNQMHQQALLSRDKVAAQVYADSLRSAGHSFLSSLALPDVESLPAGLGLGLGPLLQTFCAVDVLAERTKRYWGYRWRFLASAAMLASASSSLRLLSPANGDLIESLAFSVGALFAVGTYLWVALSSQRNAYLDYRALAEGLRFQMYWMCAGESTLVTDHYVQKYGGEIGWVRHALDACMVVHPVSGLSARQVLRSWIADQLAYLNGNGNHRRRRQHRLSVAQGNNLLLTGLLCSVGALILVLLSGRNYALALALLIGGMKLATGVGAAWLSLNHKMGHSETLMQADQLRAVYARAELALNQLETAHSSEAEKERHARDLLFALGKAVLEENACWLAAYQQRRVSWHGK